MYSKLIDRELNSQTEILVTSGAYEALFSAINGHVDDGDEVIIIEPFFDCYEPMVITSGGTPKFIPLRPVSLCLHYNLSSGFVHDLSDKKPEYPTSLNFDYIYMLLGLLDIKYCY